jgi:hypothetical protein
MSKLCFSFPADAASAIEIRGATQSGAYACFSDQADVPLSMPSMCFSYSVDASRGAGNREAGPPVPPGLRRMPFGSCFRY